MIDTLLMPLPGLLLSLLGEVIEFKPSTAAGWITTLPDGSLLRGRVVEQPLEILQEELANTVRVLISRADVPSFVLGQALLRTPARQRTGLPVPEYRIDQVLSKNGRMWHLRGIA